MSNRVVKWLVPLFIILASVGVFAYMKATKPVSKQVKAGEKAWPVNAWSVHKQRLSPHVGLYGVIESPHHTTVSAVIGADVRSLEVLEGQKVNKGQALIALDPQDVGLVLTQRKAEVARLQSDLRTARKDVKRQEALFKKRIISPAQIDKARQSVATLKAQLAGAQARLDQTQNDAARSSVVAPFSGRITTMHVSPGDRVGVGSPLVSLYDSNNLEIRAQLPNEVLGKLRRLWDAKIPVHAKVGSQQTPATLSRITGEVKANSAGIDALFRLTREDKSLSLGQSVAITLLLPAEDNVVFLPYEALYDLDKIYLINEGRLERMRVERLGQYLEKGLRHVLVSAKNLPAGGKILVTQLSNAITGLKVEISHLDGVKQQAAAKPQTDAKGAK